MSYQKIGWTLGWHCPDTSTVLSTVAPSFQGPRILSPQIIAISAQWTTPSRLPSQTKPSNLFFFSVKIFLKTFTRHPFACTTRCIETWHYAWCYLWHDSMYAYVVLFIWTTLLDCLLLSFLYLFSFVYTKWKHFFVHRYFVPHLILLSGQSGVCPGNGKSLQP